MIQNFLEVSDLITEGMVLWESSLEQRQNSQLYQFMTWMHKNRGMSFSNYDELWQWSVDNTEGFWSSLWEYFNIKSSSPYTKVYEGDVMPDIHWFPGAKLNYAEHVFRHVQKNKPALIFRSEHKAQTEVTWDHLENRVGALASVLKQLDVKPGERVVSYMPNIPESVIAFLACASIGAIWSSCSPDFGTTSVIDRFKQIEPKVLFAVDGYQYNGKAFNRLDVVAELQRQLTTVTKTILVPYLHETVSPDGLNNTVLWSEVIEQTAALEFEQLPFEHPLWILYSSGTTGLPKAIVQGHGGILLEHLKLHGLQCDVTSEDRFFWFTTTGWTMWNIALGALLTGASALLYDGNPGYPRMDVLWDFAEKSKMTHFGTSASYIASCMKDGIVPSQTYDLSPLRFVGSTGSPLPTEGYKWVYDHVKRDVWLASMSGGTDICSGFVGGCLEYPVRAGEIQCRLLGCKVEAFDDDGGALQDAVGELVATKPLPSMPLFFWNDPGKKRYRESYFEMYPGYWRQGDWIKIKPTGSCVIYGRSDSTINRHGIRMGTSDIYQVVEALHEVADSLVVDLELLGRKSCLSLFVVLTEGTALDEELKQKICTQIRAHVSPRHVPDEIFAVNEIPRTLNGKKMEVPIRKILLGHPLEKSVNRGSMMNPQSLPYFIELARAL